VVDAEFPVSEQMWKIGAIDRNDDALDFGLKDCGRAHQAWLVRAVDDAIAEIGAPENLAGIVQSMQLSMGQDGLFGRLPALISRHQLAFANDDGADRQLTGLFGFARLLDGERHIFLVDIHEAESEGPRVAARALSVTRFVMEEWPYLTMVGNPVK
jgi:hypothetical protein